MWAALGGVGVILAGIITVGAVLEDDSDASTADTVATSSAEQSSPQPAREREADPSSSVDPMICETKPGGDPCKFGQTAIYSDKVRSGEVKLEITVGAPVEFTPSGNASTLYDRPLEPVNVYFPVTIKNISPKLAVGMIHGRATNAEQGETDTKSVSDGDVDSFGVGRAVGMPVGESISVKDGWSMTTLKGVEFRVNVSGLSGYSITFTR